MPEPPTVAQVCAYLARHGWRRHTETGGSTIWHGPSGWQAIIPDWPDDDTRLLEHSSAIAVIAEDAGRTIEQIVADIAVDVRGFEGCNRRCWPYQTPESEWRHTLRWGSCARAAPPEDTPATLDIPRTWTAGDGYPAAGWVSVPLELFAPWARYLPPSEQHRMLEQIAGTRPDDRAGLVATWRLVAEGVAERDGRMPSRAHVEADRTPASFRTGDAGA